MEFWEMAYKLNWVTSQQLRQAVITDKNPYGEITPEEYKKITGKDF